MAKPRRAAYLGRILGFSDSPMLVLRSPDGVGDAPVPHLLGLGVPLARAILAAHGGQLEELGEEADAMKIVIRFPPSRVMPTGSTVSTAAPYREV